MPTRCQEACFSGRELTEFARPLRVQAYSRKFKCATKSRLRCKLLVLSANQALSDLPRANGPVIGIDLGTSNSAVAVIKDGAPVILPLEAGRATMPSVIWLGKVRGNYGSRRGHPVSKCKLIFCKLDEALKYLSSFQEPKDKLTGVAAQQVVSRDPLNCFYSVKRLIGREYANCYREAAFLVYKLVEGPKGETFLWSPARCASSFEFWN